MSPANANSGSPPKYVALFKPLIILLASLVLPKSFPPAILQQSLTFLAGRAARSLFVDCSNRHEETSVDFHDCGPLFCSNYKVQSGQQMTSEHGEAPELEQAEPEPVRSKLDPHLLTPSESKECS